MERNGRKGKIRKGHGSRILPAVSSRQDCELIELVSLSLSALFPSSSNLRRSFPIEHPVLVYSSCTAFTRWLVSIDPSIDPNFAYFFSLFFFFFIPRFTRAPKLSTSLTTSGEANDIRLTRSTTAVTGNPSVFTLHGGFLDRANAEGNRRHVNDVDEQKFERSQLECSPMREFHRRSFRRVLLLPRPRPPPPPPSDLQISPGR